MTEIEVKGLAFVNVVGAIEEARGDAFKKRMIDAMPDDSRSALRLGSVLANGWYPVRWYRELFAAAVAASRKPNLPRELGRISVRRDVKGVHRLLFRIMSVETLQAQGARFFKSYFKPSEVSVERVDRRSARVYFSQCVGFDRNIWQEQLGGVEELLASCGVTSPRVLVLAGGGDQDTSMAIESRWR